MQRNRKKEEEEEEIVVGVKRRVGVCLCESAPPIGEMASSRLHKYQRFYLDCLQCLISYLKGSQGIATDSMELDRLQRLRDSLRFTSQDMNVSFMCTNTHTHLHMHTHVFDCIN